MKTLFSREDWLFLAGVFLLYLLLGFVCAVAPQIVLRHCAQNPSGACAQCGHQSADNR